MLKTSWFALCLLLSSFPTFANTGQGDGHQFLVQTSLWTHHYQHDPDHNNHQELVNLLWYPSVTYQPHAVEK